MNVKSPEPLASIHDAMSDLKSQAEDAGAEDVAFYLGAALLAAEEKMAMLRAESRSRRRSTATK